IHDLTSPHRWLDRRARERRQQIAEARRRWRRWRQRAAVRADVAGVELEVADVDDARRRRRRVGELAFARNRRAAAAADGGGDEREYDRRDEATHGRRGVKSDHRVVLQTRTVALDGARRETRA